MRNRSWLSVLGLLLFSAVLLADGPNETGAMAELANRFLEQSASDPQIIKSLSAQLATLPGSSVISEAQVVPVLHLLQSASTPAQRAAAFFSAQSLIQTAENVKLLDSRLSRPQVEKTFNLISNFANKAARQALEVSETASVVSAVNKLSELAALTARRDMTASLVLRAKIYARYQAGVPASAISQLEELFLEINAATEAASLENFDLRLLEAVQRISPSAQTLGEAVDQWHAQLKTHFSEANPETLLVLAPDQIRSELYETAQAIRRVIPRLKKELEAQSGVVDRTFFGLTSQSLEALHLVDGTLERIAERMRRMTEPSELERVWQSRHLMKLVATMALEASLSKSQTAPALANILSTRVEQIWHKNEPFLSPDALHEVHQLINQQTSESWVRAFINRRMAVVYAQSALLLGEAISVPFTWGASAAAMPATLQAIVTGLQVAGKTALIATSSLNIADRVVQDGVKAIINPSSALDALTIVMLLPRPLVARDWFHEVGRMAVVGHASFGAYQLAFAENIASTLRQQGYAATADDIRRQALGHLAQAFLLGIVEWNEVHRTGLVTSNPLSVLQERFRYMVFPHQAFMDTFKSLAPALGTPLAGAASVLPALQYVAYDYLLASESLMYFYASTDFGYFNHIQKHQPYPELEAGESAVTFIGFDEADLLYAGSHSVDSHRLEREKYGDRYFVYDFNSRQDFLQKLEQHAKLHGPIKYLRIMTHGLPGKLYTSDVAAAAVDDVNEHQSKAEKEGWIDTAWLKENKTRLNSFASWGIAPEARVVLFACLVGANMDSPVPGIKADAGDEFLTAFAKTLLPRGGLIDSSIRFLMGLDTIFGGLLNYSARKEIRPILPVQLYRPENGNTFVVDESLRNKVTEGVLAAAPPNGLVAADPTEMIQYSASRLWNMLTQLHQLGYRYGIQLEGPWWSTPRYKHAKVEPGGEVFITTF